MRKVDWLATWSGRHIGEKSRQSCKKVQRRKKAWVSMSPRRLAILIAIGGAVAVVVAVVAIRHFRPRWTTIQGAVMRHDTDTYKELPIAGVEIAATRGDETIRTQSDASGYFRISFPDAVLPGQTVDLNFNHAGYRSLNLATTIRFRSSLRRLVVVAMQPMSAETETDSSQPAKAVSNIRVRYTVNSESEQNVGSEVRTFQVLNEGDVPCRHNKPCSPDGYWKASVGSLTLDAGVGNEFRDARASCIAGPCPFTRIDPSGFVNGGRTISASALDWSDTATFLLQAEVFHSAIVSNVRESYPVEFGRALNFTLPSSAEGVCIEAELNGQQMVFPLGPELYLSWADCEARTGSTGDKTTVYQCVLKPGYHF
jgi:hypothetical protein